jgi:hypothetical protein
METDSIVAALDAKIAQLTQARAIFAEGQETVSTVSKTIGRPRKKRVMSEEARARIAAAQRKRWAAKATAEKTPKKQVGRPKAIASTKAKPSIKVKATPKPKKVKAAPKPKIEPSQQPEGEAAK